MRPRVLLAMVPSLAPYAFGSAQLERLAAVADLLDPEPLGSFDGDEASALLARCDVVLGHWGCPRLDEDVLSRAPELRLVAYAAGTVRDVVTPAVWRRGVSVTSAAAANAVPVAEFTLAVILLANKGTFVHRERLRDPALRLRLPKRIGNVDKQVGIIGASHVGRHLIELLRPFALTVVVSDPFLTEADADRLGVRAVELDELLSTSDIVTVHAPDLPTTRGMIGATELSRLRNGATLINTARPALIDQEALAAEVETGRISAVLDVTDPEPLPPESPILASARGVRDTAHRGSRRHGGWRAWPTWPSTRSADSLGATGRCIRSPSATSDGSHDSGPLRVVDGPGRRARELHRAARRGARRLAHAGLPCPERVRRPPGRPRCPRRPRVHARAAGRSGRAGRRWCPHPRCARAGPRPDRRHGHRDLLVVPGGRDAEPVRVVRHQHPPGRLYR